MTNVIIGIFILIITITGLYATLKNLKNKQ